MYETAKCDRVNGMTCHPYYLEQKHQPNQQMGYRVLPASNLGRATHTPQTSNGRTLTGKVSLGSTGGDSKVHSRGEAP